MAANGRKAALALAGGPTRFRLPHDDVYRVVASRKFSRAGMSALHGFLGIIIGALATVLGGLFATHWAYKRNVDLHQMQQQSKINGLLRAIRCELEILAELYQKTGGGSLGALKPGEPFLSTMTISERYFMVYPNNTNIVGQIDDSELVKQIVMTYNLAIALQDAFKVNNQYYKELLEAQKHGCSWAEEQQFKAKMVEWAELFLKQADADLRTHATRLRGMIDAYLAADPIEGQKMPAPAVTTGAPTSQRPPKAEQPSVSETSNLKTRAPREPRRKLRHQAVRKIGAARFQLTADK